VSYLQQGLLYNLAELFDLLLAATDVAVRDVGLLLDLHKRDRRVNLGRQRQLDLVLGPVDTIEADGGPLETEKCVI